MPQPQKESRDARIEDLRDQSATLATAAAGSVDPVVADLQKRLDDALAKAARSFGRNLTPNPRQPPCRSVNAFRRGRRGD